MLTLHTFGPAFGAPDGSPFCMKLEIFMKLAGLPYRLAPCDLQQAPKGKGPYVDLGGELIGDSSLIMRRLERDHGLDLDAGLAPGERAVGHALGVMLEERTYFAVVHERWHTADSWPKVRAAYFAEMPDAVAEAIRADSLETQRRQGIGRHAMDEIVALAEADIEALATWLGDKPWMMGEVPRRLDCTAAAFSIALGVPALGGPIAAVFARRPGLVAYRQRALERFFPAFAEA